MKRVAAMIVLATCGLGCRQLLGIDPASEARPSDGALDTPNDTIAPFDTVDAWLDPWTNRKPITISAANVTAPGNLIDFPVVIATVDIDLLTKAQPTGADIVFTAADGVTVLASEIELYGFTGLVAWVKVPTFSATADTVLYMYYGNPLSPPLPPAAATWTASYQAVWHLAENPGPGGAGEIKDSTAGGHHGTAGTQMVANDLLGAKLGNGIDFDGSGGFIDFPTAMDFGNAFTISTWAKVDNVTGIRTLLANSLDGAATNGFRFFINTNSSNDHKVLFETADGITSNAATTGTNAVVANVFANVVVAVDRLAGQARIYVNGADVTIDPTISTSFATNSDFEIGRMEGQFEFDGTLDEVTVASTVRPAEWIQTAFTNQSNPAAFHTFGPEETR